MRKENRIYFISLGCDKNRVDAEIMCYKLAEAGYSFTDSMEGATIALINTCGFISSSKEEAIEVIFDMIREKNAGNLKAVIVTGCLSERHGEEMKELIPEIDAIVGIGQNGSIVEIVDGVLAGKEHQFERCPYLLPMNGERLISTPLHYAFLKIAEGCDNHCTYCAIPGIRGRYRSRRKEEILSEAEKLVSYGIREIILVAQDTTSYGSDCYENYRLADLLRELAQIKGLWKIRILYAYPERITEDLIDVIADTPQIAKYLDIPLQHADAAVLKRMGRIGSFESYLSLLEKLRSRIPGITVRSTFIAGFSGETEEQFQTLLRFIGEAKIDRAGCFAFSSEEGTPADRMGDQIPEEIREERAKRFYQLQTEMTAEKQRQLIGRSVSAINDGYSEENGAFRCRGDMDAPEDDCCILVPSEYDLIPGEIYTLSVSGINGLDLTGTPEKN